MDYWLKSLGGGAREDWLRDDWMNERSGLLLRVATFPTMPRMHTGDGIVYYAVGHRVIFAAGTTTSRPFEDPDDDSRWPFRVKVSVDQMVEFIHDGEPLDKIDVDPTRLHPLRSSIRQHSHIRISQPIFEAAVAALHVRGGTHA